MQFLFVFVALVVSAPLNRGFHTPSHVLVRKSSTLSETVPETFIQPLHEPRGKRDVYRPERSGKRCPIGEDCTDIATA